MVYPFCFRFLDTHCEDSRGLVLSSGHCDRYSVVMFMTLLSKPDTKPVDHRFQKLLFSEVLHQLLDENWQQEGNRSGQHHHTGTGLLANWLTKPVTKPNNHCFQGSPVQASAVPALG